MKTRAIRQDHKQMVKVKEIEQQINEVCKALSQELGFDVGWSDARELAAGTSPAALKQQQ
jgi:hypothetical protein